MARLSITLPESVFERIAKQAYIDKRSMSNLCAFIIETSFLQFIKSKGN